MGTPEGIDKLLHFMNDNKQHVIGRRSMTNAEVLVPLVNTDGAWHLLLEKRAVGITQGSEICFPGGEVDKTVDREPGDAAVRETVEETGIDKSRILLKGQFGTIIVLRGIIVDCFVGILNLSSINELRPDPAEVGKVFLLPLDLFIKKPPVTYAVRPVMQSVVTDKDGNETVLFPARELNLPEKYWRDWSGKNQTVLYYDTDEGPLWGVTAEIINELVLAML